MRLGATSRFLRANFLGGGRLVCQRQGRLVLAFVLVPDVGAYAPDARDLDALAALRAAGVLVRGLDEPDLDAVWLRAFAVLYPYVLPERIFIATVEPEVAQRARALGMQPLLIHPGFRLADAARVLTPAYTQAALEVRGVIHALLNPAFPVAR